MHLTGPHNAARGVGTSLAGPQSNQSKKMDFFPKLLKAYPNDTNSCTTNASQVHLFLGFQIQNDQLVPGDVHDGMAVQQL